MKWSQVVGTESFSTGKIQVKSVVFPFKPIVLITQSVTSLAERERERKKTELRSHV